MRTRIEHAKRMMAAVERLTVKCDDILYVLVKRAEAHAKALDPTGTKYFRFRVPTIIERIVVDETSQTVTLHGYCSRQGGPDTEKWTMPLDYANGDGDPAEWLDSIEATEKAKSEARDREIATRTERIERAELKRLQEKYSEN